MKTENMSKSVSALEAHGLDSKTIIWLLDYVRRNDVDLDWIVSEDEKAAENGLESLKNGLQSLVKVYSLQEKSDNTKNMYEILDSLSAEEQKDIAAMMIIQFYETLLLQMDNNDYSEIYLIDISKENYGFDYIEYGRDTVSVSELLKNDETLQSLVGTSGQETIGQPLFQYSFDGKIYMTCYTPIYSGGTAKAVLVLGYECVDYMSILWNNLKVMLLTGIIALLITDALIVLFVYYKAIKPIASVKKAMLTYKDDKDSSKAAEKMQTIKVHNEIGVLAESFSQMTDELDNYMTENLRLTSEKERVAAELEIAAGIQLDMLPTEFPSSSQYELFASMTPAKEVGGDFYDFFMIDDDHLGMVIADVSGKGMPAALFMMKSKIIIKQHALSGGTPSEILEKANNAICENNTNMMFVTVWLGILELSTGKLTAANAGHEYPVIRKPDEMFELLKDKHGIALGIRKNRTFKEYELTLPKGSTLFVYTDGAAEATNADGTLYGTDRLLEALNRETNAAPQKLINDVHEAIDTFVGDAPQFDDLTMLCVKIN